MNKENQKLKKTLLTPKECYLIVQTILSVLIIICLTSPMLEKNNLGLYLAGVLLIIFFIRFFIEKRITRNNKVEENGMYDYENKD